MRNKSNNEQPVAKPINCIKCVYYYVTWDPAMPKGCKAFGFKTRELPSVVVKKSSGHACLKFEAKH
ncbi:uracil-DNA glycosylase [Paenibacillus agricola]|uniref:Uracil-DNA glycosylase n=1 Tax=Paenibacillus agricola TaxID=2716264 RepID=A0ABX0J5P5_9BACL|nr:uracil-DNA glycosylase [Paenibacillus agricola]NHN29411.1 uracil-DNA glycosylase [Paenibacillus agricola]